MLGMRMWGHRGTLGLKTPFSPAYSRYSWLFQVYLSLYDMAQIPPDQIL